MTGVLVRREDYDTDVSEEKPQKDTGRRWPDIDQGERPQETPTLWTPRSRLLISRTVRKSTLIKLPSLC